MMGIIIGIIILIVIYVLIYNSFQSKITNMEEANSGMDVALSKRFDALTAIVESINASTKHEEKLLVKITEIRHGQMTLQEKDRALSSLSAVVSGRIESYPELKTDKQFAQLQLIIVDVEEHLSAARRFYNSAVSDYNKTVRVFPYSIIAAIKGYKPAEFFVVEDEKRAPVKMNFR